MSPYFYSLSFTSLLSVILALVVIFKNPNSLVNRTWALASFGCAIWALFFVLTTHSNSKENAIIFGRILHIAAAWMVTFVVHFCCALTRLRDLKSWILRWLYFNSVFFSLVGFTDLVSSARPFLNFNFYVSAGPLYPYYTFHLLFCFAYSEYILIKGLKLHQSRIKEQIKYVILSLTCAYPGGVFSLFPVYGLPIEPVTMHFMWLYVPVITYAILKHQLMDIRVVLKKSLMYTTWLIAATVPYVGLVLIIHGLASGSLKPPSVFNLFSITSLVCCIMSLMLSAFFFISGKAGPLRCFAFFNLAVAAWGLGCFVTASSKTLWGATTGLQIALYGGYFIGPIFYQLSQLVASRPFNRYVLSLGYGQAIFFSLYSLINPSGLFVGAYKTFDFIAPRSTHIVTLAVIIFTILVSFGFRSLFYAYTNNNGQKKSQAAYLLVGFIPGFIGGMSVIPSVYYAFEIIYPIGNAGISIYLAIMAYALYKHDLLEIRAALKRTVIFASLIIFASLVYFTAVYGLHILLYSNISRVGSYTAFMSILLIALMFKPIELLFTRSLEKRFFRGTIGQIAEQKERLESELARRERLKSVGIMAAGMAHEIKNPLTSIKTFAEHLPKKYDDPDFRDKFSRIVVDEVDRVNNIVKQLLEFSKPSSPDLKPVLIGDLLDQTLGLINNNMIRHHVEVTKELDMFAMVSGDRNQLRQAFLNLFLNSIQSMRDGGKLHVSAHSDQGGTTQISITDTGCGMTKEQAQHAFDPFFTTKEDGTGLGLAIVHSIIAKHGGKIEIKSKVGEGTTVSVFLKSLD